MNICKQSQQKERAPLARTAAIGIRVEPDIKAAAEKAAAADRRTVASLVEKVLVEYLEENGYLRKPKRP